MATTRGDIRHRALDPAGTTLARVKRCPRRLPRRSPVGRRAAPHRDGPWRGDSCGDGGGDSSRSAFAGAPGSGSGIGGATEDLLRLLLRRRSCGEARERNAACRDAVSPRAAAAGAGRSRPGRQTCLGLLAAVTVFVAAPWAAAATEPPPAARIRQRKRPAARGAQLGQLLLTCPTLAGQRQRSVVRFEFFFARPCLPVWTSVADPE